MHIILLPVSAHITNLGFITLIEFPRELENTFGVKTVRFGPVFLKKKKKKQEAGDAWNDFETNKEKSCQTNFINVQIPKKLHTSATHTTHFRGFCMNELGNYGSCSPMRDRYKLNTLALFCFSIIICFSRTNMHA